MADDWFQVIVDKRLKGCIALSLTEERLLVEEVERLRAGRNVALKTLISDEGWPQTSDLGTAARYMAHQRRGALIELAEIHDVLAEALGYQKAPTLEEDPNCPCPGDYVTGDHTAATLAAEAAKKLARRQDYVRALGRALERANNNVAELTQKLASSNDNTTSQIVELQQELAARKRQCSCSYWADQDKIMPSPDCPAHGVDASDSPMSKSGKKAELRQEIAALRCVCSCVYWPEADGLMASPDCPTHGVAANNKRLAGEKALNTLAYVRKYFMGSDHGHEV